MTHNANALHIFNWCCNSAEHEKAMRAARAYPEGWNFSSSRASAMFGVMSDAYRKMRYDLGGEIYSAVDILAAAIMGLEQEDEK